MPPLRIQKEDVPILTHPLLLTNVMFYLFDSLHDSLSYSLASDTLFENVALFVDD